MKNRLLVALFVIYLVLLAWVVLWKLQVPLIGGAAFLPHPIKWVPFVASGDADASSPLEVVANVVLFVPFGIYLGLLTPTWRWRAVGVFFGASLVLETLQHLFSIGTFDTSDLISNTAGGALGLGLLVLMRHRLDYRTGPIMTRVLLVFTVVALVAVGAYMASPIRYAQQPDVIVHPTP